MRGIDGGELLLALLAQLGRELLLRERGDGGLLVGESALAQRLEHLAIGRVSVLEIVDKVVKQLVRRRSTAQRVSRSPLQRRAPQGRARGAGRHIPWLRQDRRVDWQLGHERQELLPLGAYVELACLIHGLQLRLHSCERRSRQLRSRSFYTTVARRTRNASRFRRCCVR